MTSSAAPVTHVVEDELVRDARTRARKRQLESRWSELIFAGAGAVVAAACVASLWLHGGPAFNPLELLFFAVLYAGVSRVEFEVGWGSAIPTQLILVPMLFALPIGVVPLTVTLGLVLRTTAERPWPLRNPARVFPMLVGAVQALGPVLVIALAHGLPLRWSAWPVYVLALLAQFAFDLFNVVTTGIANRLELKHLLRFMSLVYLVDAALAPIGLAIAFASSSHAVLALLSLPLVGLLKSLSLERQQRIDHALELSDAYRGTAFLLGDVVEADDAYTGSHSRHVVDLVLAVCDELEIPASERRDAEFVALLHDVGKIRIPSEIINKPGALDANERAIIETHTIEGEQMLERVGGLLAHVGRLVRSCHEHWDGAGYPDGLAGEAIPLVARIVCACDAFSAMTTDRAYRKARSAAEALEEMVRCAGTQFDPDVVSALVRVERG